jgi:hypothetical protein
MFLASFSPTPSGAARAMFSITPTARMNHFVPLVAHCHPGTLLRFVPVVVVDDLAILKNEHFPAVRTGLYKSLDAILRVVHLYSPAMFNSVLVI